MTGTLSVQDLLLFLLVLGGRANTSERIAALAKLHRKIL